MIWLFTVEGKNLRECWETLLSKELWLTKSTRLDALFSLGYLFLMYIPIAAVESGSFSLTLGALSRLTEDLIPEEWTITTSVLGEAVLATLVTMLAIDFSSYLAHLAMHRIPFLWSIHSVHHAAEKLTPLTTYRQHPLEPLILNTCRGCASAIALALFHAVFTKQTPVITVFGMGAGFFVYMFTTNLHHCPIPVRYPRWLRTVLISPHHHQIHHSCDKRHHNRNFGVVFSIWDRLFATYFDAEPSLGELRFGIDSSNADQHSLRAALLLPFKGLANLSLALTRNRRRQNSVLVQQNHPPPYA